MQKEGIGFLVIPYPKSLIERMKLFRMLKQFDVTFLQKKLLTPLESFLLKRASRRLVFDFDDAIMYKHDVHGGDLSPTRFKRFKTIVRLSDLVISGNKVLEAHARPWNSKVVVIPTGVPVDVPLKKYETSPRVVRIGWIGGTINLSYLTYVMPVLQRLWRRHPFELVIVSGREIKSDEVPVRFIPWRYRWQYHVLSKIDIGIMPLPKSPHAEGKCGYKALQYMTVAVPPVCSKVGAIGDIVRDGQDGLLVEGPEGFFEALSALITDRELRKRLGQSSRERVLESFSLEKVAKQLAAHLRGLL